MMCNCAKPRLAGAWSALILLLLTSTWLVLPAGQAVAADAAWRPAAVPLMTRWGRQLDPASVWAEYPRPQLVRAQWQNLNGLWDHAVVPRDAQRPTEWNGPVLVPFAIESALSGVGRPVLPTEALWYRREISVARPPADQRVLLHFDAVDWEATVWVNDQQVGTHRGGSTPFTCDITDALRDGSSQQLVVRVWDPTDAGPQPRGKQVLEPGGIWYTAVTGIWQTVWLETVPASHITQLNTASDVRRGDVTLTATVANAGPSDLVEAEVLKDGEVVAQGQSPPGSPITIHLPDARLWTPDDPTLYDVRVRLTRDGRTIDEATSYVALRSISVEPDERGVLRLMLNHRPQFQYGPLDQGWWPDGLLTPPSEEAMVYDLQVLKSLGMNMLRKHIKVEPSRYYYHCDRLGLIVWQDMPSAMQRGRDHGVRPDQPHDATFTEDERRQFRTELREMIDHLRFFPCIAVWVPFNEGWGQHDTNEVLQWVAQYDPTRLVNGPSGWTDRGYGAMKDMHQYPGPGMFPLLPDRASVLGEFGGLGLPVEGHLWKQSDNWGYRTYRTSDELIANYEQLMQRLYPLIGAGLAAAVYTQTTDVEIEVNGLMTYDREVVKLPPERFATWHRRLTGPAPSTRVLVDDARSAPARWRYTFDRPQDNWTDPDADVSQWLEGTGGFGTPGTPGSVVGTQWSGSDIWVRRDFELPSVPAGDVYLSIHHDEDAEVFINGTRVAELKGYTTGYTLVPLDERSKALLREGKNSLAIHCHQTSGGQYIDAGLVVLVLPEK